MGNCVRSPPALLPLEEVEHLTDEDPLKPSFPEERPSGVVWLKDELLEGPGIVLRASSDDVVPSTEVYWPNLTNDTRVCLSFRSKRGDLVSS